MNTDYVILVDGNDQQTGVCEKLEAHQKGLLHRAFSVFVFNKAGELLIHRRAESKYHSPGLWTNTCCSHPRPEESTLNAAKRRLNEEMGMATALEEVFAFEYRADFDNGLTEHEYDHVLFGWSDDLPTINRDEVAEYRYMPVGEIAEWMNREPEAFTVWFRICFPNVLDALRKVA
ncbi:MAG: isopentenyl-diphosphate Delta-isomerase [Flavobacteriales bacterium]|jgi:isopentenyl-diphosphate delta-isomerase